MAIVDAGGVRLEYFEAGDGDEVAVLIHGAASSARIWHTVQGLLAQAGVRSLAIGMRGAGASERSSREEDYTPARYAEDLRGAVDALGVGAFTLVGHSLGTLVARFFVRDHPERVRALVLMAGPHPARPALTEEQRAARLARSLEQPAEPSPDWLRQHVGLPAEVREALWRDIRNNPPERVRGQMLPRGGLEGAEQRIAVPTLFVGGDADNVVPPEQVLRAYLEMPEAHRHLHVFHGVGHYPNAQVPDALTGVLVQFMRETVAEQAPAAASTA